MNSPCYNFWVSACPLWVCSLPDLQTLIEQLLDEEIGIDRDYVYVLIKEVKSTSLGLSQLMKMKNRTDRVCRPHKYERFAAGSNNKNLSLPPIIQFFETRVTIIAY